MKLIWANDLHFNMATEEAFLAWCQSVNKSGADALVICGDIETGTTVVARLKRMALIIELPIYFVLGNHDFYDSSIGEVRFAVQGLAISLPNLTYLTRSGVISLTHTVALVGHDGWADARSGNWHQSSVTLNDDRMIGDFAKNSKLLIPGLRAKLADESAEHLVEMVRKALSTHEEVIVATHVPPSANTAFHEGKRSETDWLPHMVNTVLGEKLTQVFFEFLDKGEAKRLTLLCGHTHGVCDVELTPGFRVLGGAATYEHPSLQTPLNLPGEIVLKVAKATPKVAR